MTNDAMAYHLGSLEKDLSQLGGDDPISDQQFFLLAGKLCRIWVHSGLPPVEGSIANARFSIEAHGGDPSAHVNYAVRLRDASIFHMAYELWRRVRPW